MIALHRYIFSVLGIYHIWFAQIRDHIHDLIFEVWEIGISQLWSTPVGDIHGLPKPGGHCLEISMVYLCSKQINYKYGINMGYICLCCFFQCHITLRLAALALLNSTPMAVLQKLVLCVCH